MREWRHIAPSHPQAFNLQGVPGVEWDERIVKIHRSHEGLIRDEVLLDYDLIKLLYGDVPRVSAGPLRPYQEDSQLFMAYRFGSLLADAPRVGKTLPAVSCWSRDGVMLIVAPLAVRPVWLEWINKVHPGANVVFVKGKDYDKAKVIGADIIFSHYNVLPDWEPFHKGEFATIIYDEIHLLSNYKANRTKAATRLSCKATEHVIGLTGTPIWNKAAQIYTILKIINKGGWGTFKDFSTRYFDGKDGSFGWEYNDYPDSRHVGELKARLREIMLARSLKDVFKDLPPITWNVETIEPTNTQRTKLDTLLYQFREGKKTVLIGENASMRKHVAKLKVPRAIELTKEFLSAGDPVVLWVWHEGVVNELVAGLPTARVITGNTPEEDRGEILTSWRNSLSPLIISLPIGQVGIDLSHAPHAILVEYDYTQLDIGQEIFRTWHISRPMTVTALVADHPLERKIVDVIMHKCKISAELGIACADTDIQIIQEAFKDEADFSNVLSRLIKEV